MSESTRLLIVAAVGIVCAFLVGLRVNRDSQKKEKIYGGALPQYMNLICSMAVSSLLPSIITGLILGVIHVIAPVIFSLVVTCLISMVIFAVVELPAHKQLAPVETEDEEVWTAEKARTSGL